MGFEVLFARRAGLCVPALELEIPAPQRMSSLMIYRVLLALVVAGATFSAQPAEAAYSAAERAAIRSMPITQRPYRPGHFYGNTVRILNRVGRY